MDKLGEFLREVLNTPWSRTDRHCWRLVARAQAELFGRTLPLGPERLPARADRRALLGVDATLYGWRETDRPVHGAVARMYRVGGNPSDLEHAGVYLAIEGGRVLHSDLPHGVVLDRLFELEKMRGWKPRWFVPVDEVEA